MKLQTSNNWSCLPCAFAMALGISVEQLIKMIGHDGSEEPYTSLPGQKAGFHEQECIEVCQQLGYACTPIEIVPQMKPVPDGPVRAVWFPSEKLTADPEERNWQRFVGHLKWTRGVITGVKINANSKVVIGHAVAWDGLVHDSQGKGFVYPIDEANNYGFVPRTYWKLQEIKDARGC